jgi:sarcosine oxidase subunit beta
VDIVPLQACVSEPMKAWLDTIIVSGTLHVYVSQTARGELVMGAAVDPAELHSTRSSLEFVTSLADQMLDLFPFLAGVKIVRQWGGMADMTPDFAPVMGKTEVGGFYLDAGWGTWGFKATPVCGETMAYTVAHDTNHRLIEAFGGATARVLAQHFDLQLVPAGLPERVTGPVRQDLGWLVELVDGRKPFAAVTHCLCGPP